MVDPTPNKEARQRLRHDLTRQLLAATAGIALASALMFLGFGDPLDWAARLTLGAGFLGLGGVAFALRRDAGTGVQGKALPYVIGAAIGLSGVAAAVAGDPLRRRRRRLRDRGPAGRHRHARRAARREGGALTPEPRIRGQV